MSKKSFWEPILGIKPEGEFTPEFAERKCYKCNSKNIENMNAGSWSSKYKCNDCGYFTYVVYVDRMGGGGSDDVAISQSDMEI